MSFADTNDNQEREAQLFKSFARLGSLPICLLLVIPAFVSVYYVIGPVAVWPENHEFVTFLLRTRIYVEHMQQGDFLPVWSTFDNHGLGSPLPALYHKLFYWVSGSLGALGLSLPNAVMWAIIGFLWFGAVGMFLLLRRIDCSKLTAAAGGTYFIFANYIVTDWLIRGAVAELAAVVLVPWIFWSFFISLDEGRVLKRLGLFLALTFLAHPVMAFYAVLLLAVLGLFAIGTGRMRLTVSGSIRSLPAVLLSIIITAPFAAVLLILRNEYDMDRLSQEPRLLPTLLYRPLKQYLWDTDWIWGQTWLGYTTQIDLPLFLLLFVALLLMVLLRNRPDRKRFLDASILVLIFALGMALQLRWSAPFYNTVPGANYLQFPWRLLGFMTPALIASAMIISEISSRRIGPWLCLATCLIGIATSGVFRLRAYGDIPHIPDTLILGHNHVYQPVAALYDDPDEQLAAVDRQRCTVRSMTADTDKSAEHMVRTYSINCPDAAEVALPIYSAPGMSVRQEGGEAAPCLDSAEFRSLCSVRVGTGDTSVSVRTPTLWSMIRSAL